MKFIKRLLQDTIKLVLSQRKSILLLGARQSGKTTLLNHQIKADLSYTFLDVDTRRKFASSPDNLIKEIEAYKLLNPSCKMLTVLIDEIQKVPEIIDTVQQAIDSQLALFMLTGSSARKLKRNPNGVNWLPGRVISLRMDALSILEMEDFLPPIEVLLLNGSLPEIVLQKDIALKERLLASYVNTYLEEEVRAEALTRNLNSFSQFLKYAAIEAGHPINISKLSQEIGVSRYTIEEYYQILEDCLIVERVDSLTNITSRRKLTKSPKYLFFDLGVRRIAAAEGLHLPEKYYGELFEQFVGIELFKLIHIFAPQAKLRYWKDHNGPEVDYVIEYNRQFLAIEVKYTQKPSSDDAKHLVSFSKEYPCLSSPIVICRSERPIKLTTDIIAINWKTAFQWVKEKLQ